MECRERDVFEQERKRDEGLWPLHARGAFFFFFFQELRSLQTVIYWPVLQAVVCKATSSDTGLSEFDLPSLVHSSDAYNSLGISGQS